MFVACRAPASQVIENCKAARRIRALRLGSLRTTRTLETLVKRASLPLCQRACEAASPCPSLREASTSMVQWRGTLLCGRDSLRRHYERLSCDGTGFRCFGPTASVITMLDSYMSEIENSRKSMCKTKDVRFFLSKLRVRCTVYSYRLMTLLEVRHTAMP